MKRLFDGENLMLVADSTGTRARWILRYRSPVTGKRRDAGLGSYSTAGLTKARQRAESLRSAVKSGRDPLHDAMVSAEAIRKEIAAKAAEVERTELTLGAAARAYHSIVATTFKSQKHAQQWLTSLADARR